MKSNETSLSFSKRIKEKLNTGALSSFFTGKWYPVVVAALVLIGHSFELEIYTCLINMLLLALAMFTSPSVRPLIIVLCTFTWQLPLAHSPAGPVWSDYFMSGAAPFFFGISVLLAAGSLVFAAVKFKIFSGLSFRSTPLLLSLTIFAGAFVLGGIFSPEWQPKDMLYGLLQAFVFLFVFLLFYDGLKAEKDFSELALYFSYIASVMGIILFVEMMDLYIVGNDYYGTIFNSAGSVIKDRIHLGWATWNPIGISAAVLIPVIFYGAVKGRRPWAYFIAAVAAYLASVLTLSRNSLIFATLGFAASIVIACLFGERRRKTVYRAITLGGALAIVLLVIVLWSKIAVFANDILSRGFSDNGRFDIWMLAINNFKRSPIFGTGFYSFAPPDLFNYTPVIPLLAHQTFLQLLSSMGIVGLVSYIYYRIDSVEMFIKKPTLFKSMLGISVLVLLGGSLIDNFIFNIFPSFFYSIELAIAALVYERQKEEEKIALLREKRQQKRKRR